jgi:ribose/xylose/arabinose/galactoside ABC-type transport system permease subunit
MHHLQSRLAILGMVLAVLAIALSCLSEHFLTTVNLFNVMRQISLIVILALGETLVLVAGGFDLSVGAIVGMSGVIMAAVYNATGSAALAASLALASGGVVGVLNGVLITKAGINPFIATLGMMSVVTGAVVTATSANPITFQHVFLSKIGQGYVGPIPVPVLIMLAFVVLFQIIYSMTLFGSRLKAIGGNELASRISGIAIDKYKILVFGLSGLTGSIAGIIMAARISTGQPEAGLGWELSAIAATIVGGTALAGGEGSIVGALLGAAVIGFMSNGMILLGVSSFLQPVISGLLLIVVVGLDRFRS